MVLEKNRLTSFVPLRTRRGIAAIKVSSVKSLLENERLNISQIYRNSFRYKPENHLAVPCEAKGESL